MPEDERIRSRCRRHQLFPVATLVIALTRFIVFNLGVSFGQAREYCINRQDQHQPDPEASHKRMGSVMFSLTVHLPWS